MIRLTIPGEPVGKQRPRAVNRGGFVSMYTPKETVNYESYVKSLFVQAYPEHVPFDVPLKVDIIVTRTIPKTVSQKMREAMLSGEFKVRTKPDLDNVVKTLFDALNKVAYTDDNLIYDLHAIKSYGEVPKVEMIIDEN